MNIVQIMPSQNWFAKYTLNEEDVEVIPLVCWALTGVSPLMQIIGMIQQDGRVVQADSKDKFVGYEYAEISYVDDMGSEGFDLN